MNFLDNYFYAALLTGGISTFLYLIVLVCKRFCAGNLSENNIIQIGRKIPFVALLGFYCHLVFIITIFSREKGTRYILNLVPLSTWGTDLWHLTLWIENILLLVPLGILLYILWAPFREIGLSALMGLGCSLTIESIQMLERLGKFELDDIINNVLGMLIGFLISKGVSRIFLIFQQSVFQSKRPAL